MVDDRFIYLLLTVPFILVMILIFVLRKDLRRRIIKVGLIGGIAGWTSNIWNLMDYWHPPTVFGQTILSMEDFIVGFSVAAISVTLYPFLTKTPALKGGVSKKKSLITLIVALTWIACFIIFVNGFKFSSAAVTFFLFLISTVVILIQKPSLFRRGLITGAALFVIGFINYFFLFHVLSPDYIPKYFELTDQWYNPTIFGFYPFLEGMWYLMWGIFAAVYVDYLALATTPKSKTKASKALS